MISGELSFDSYIIFYRKRFTIREKFEELSTKDKWVYKYYIYSRRFINEDVCDAIWVFLNAVCLEEYADSIHKLSHAYGKVMSAGGVDERS